MHLASGQKMGREAALTLTRILQSRKNMTRVNKFCEPLCHLFISTDGPTKPLQLVKRLVYHCHCVIQSLKGKSC